jgi:preprotein translocase subunit YajC
MKIMDTVALQGAPLAQAQPSGGAAQWMFFAFLFVGMWFLLLAPQRKRQKAQEKMIQELKTGDDVLTTSGIFGEITNVRSDRFVVKIAENTKVEILKSAVQNKVTKS